MRRVVIESRLPSHTWPARVLRITAVDAVAASCAVPGVWPPVTIDGCRYVDGGVRSNDSADHAAGAARVLVVSPMGGQRPVPFDRPLENASRSFRRPVPRQRSSNRT